MFKIQPFLKTSAKAPSGDHSVRASCYIQWCSSHRQHYQWIWSPYFWDRLKTIDIHWSLIKSCYSLMNVWNIYQHLPPRWTSYVGKTILHHGAYGIWSSYTWGFLEIGGAQVIISCLNPNSWSNDGWLIWGTLRINIPHLCWLTDGLRSENDENMSYFCGGFSNVSLQEGII